MQHLTLSQDNKLVQVIVEPRYRWLRHLLLFLLLIVAYNATLITFTGSLSVLGVKVLCIAFIQLCLYMGLAYLNIYVLVPRLFLKKKYMSYLLVLAVLLTIDFFIIYAIEYFIHTRYHMEPAKHSYLNPDNHLLLNYISDSAILGMCLAGTTITVLFRSWFTDGERRHRLETEEYRAQLLKIKNSINPGFLAGTLLKAAEETCGNPDLSADILGRLSRFLRYRLYDSTRRNVMLNSEVAFLDNYLSLIRDIRPGFTYSFAQSGGQANIAFPPSVLINVTDAILGELREDAAAVLDVNLSVEAKKVTLDIRVRSAGIGDTAERIVKNVRDILALTFAGGYSTSYAEDSESANFLVLMDTSEEAGHGS